MIKVKNLYYEYEDGTLALKDINIDGDKGNIIGIIGANGSGKSTLFLNIMGILKPKKGEIIFNGNSLKYNKSSLREYRKNINLVFQNPDQQLFYSDVYDDIAFALRNLNMDEDEVDRRVKKSLSTVKSTDLLNKPIHFLSYGQKKRISIAGILALDGQVILMDEPTSGLDPEMTRDVKDILKDIGKDKKVIISSHDMDLIYDLCDYIYVLDKGEVSYNGPTSQTFMETDILRSAKLSKPWLVKISETLGLPLFKDEEEFLNYKLEI